MRIGAHAPPGEGRATARSIARSVVRPAYRYAQRRTRMVVVTIWSGRKWRAADVHRQACAYGPASGSRSRSFFATGGVPRLRRWLSDLKDPFMKLLDLAIVLAFFASLVALAVAGYFAPRYALPGLGIIFVVFGGVVLLIRRANRPSSARIAAMRIRR